MKKQISILILTLFVLTACEKRLLRQDELLQKRNALESAEPKLLLSSVIKKSAYAYSREGGAENRTLTQAVQYMQGNRSSEDNTYKSRARPKSDLYGITAEIKLVQAALNDVHSNGLKNYEGIFRIFKSLLWSTATDLYGDIYYTEGLRGQEDILFPKFDEQKDIYPAMIQNLKEATRLLNAGTDPIDQAYDILYAGDKTKWIKFANSLRLRLLMRASKNLPNAAAEIDSVAKLPLMGEVTDNASIDYKEGDVSLNWPWGKSRMGWTQDFLLLRPCKTLVDSLKALNDERLKIWVAPIEKPWTSNKDSLLINPYTDPVTKVKYGKRTITQKGFSYDYMWEYIDHSDMTQQKQDAYKLIIDSMTIYAGYRAGVFIEALSANGSWEIPDTKWNFKISTFSKLFNQNANPLLKACMLQSDEVQFLLAEAAVKGYITGNAENFYKKGVELALKRWGEPLPANYFNNTKAKFPTSGTNNQKLAKIALQKWLGLFFMGVEAYSDIRRTRLPDIELNGDLRGGLIKFPLRFRYPDTEMANNAQNYQSAIARLDKGDTEYSTMWLIK